MAAPSTPSGRLPGGTGLPGTAIGLELGLNRIRRREDVRRVDRAFPDLGGAEHAELLNEGQRLLGCLENPRVASEPGEAQDLVQVARASADFGSPVWAEQRIIHAFEHAAGFHSGPESP
jgi:hypothetical protein